MTRSRLVAALFVLIVAFLGGQQATAQAAPGKAFHFEVSAAWLGLTPRGNVQTNSNRVDFRSDLGMDSFQSQVVFRFDMKPSARDHILFQFTPYRFSGEQTLTRSFRFGGVTYTLNERVTSDASLNYLSAGYQRDVLSRPGLDLRLIAAATYIGVKAEATRPAVGHAEVDRRIAFPLVGIAVGWVPAPQRSWFSIRGEVRGMTFGSYGRYFDGLATFGFTVSPHVTLEAGYHLMDGDGHHNTHGAKLRFHGPLISVRLHDRE